jgi:hypothetical protein
MLCREKGILYPTSAILDWPRKCTPVSPIIAGPPFLGSWCAPRLNVCNWQGTTDCERGEKSQSSCEPRLSHDGIGLINGPGCRATPANGNPSPPSRSHDHMTRVAQVLAPICAFAGQYGNCTMSALSCSAQLPTSASIPQSPAAKRGPYDLPRVLGLSTRCWLQRRHKHSQLPESTRHRRARADN